MSSSQKRPQGSEFFDFQQKYWEDFFKEWQKTVFATAGEGEGFQNQFAQSYKGYIDSLHQFYQAAGEGKSPEQVTTEWLKQARDFLSGVLDGNANSKDRTNPMSMCDPMGFFTSLHSLGYFREQQELFNKLYERWSCYLQKSNIYDREMAKIGLEALQAFQNYVLHPPADEPKLESLKDLYNKWVDVAEEIYAKYAMSEQYTRLYGDVVNALMEVKQQANKIMDYFTGLLHLPTREEMDSVHQRLHELKRENMQMRKDMQAMKTASAKKPAAPKAASAPKPKAEPKAKAKPQAKKKPVAKKPAKKKGK